MKTYHLKDLLKKDVLIIEWKDDYEIIGRIIFGKSNQKGVLENIFNLDGYILLGKPDEISEEEAENLVEAPEPYWDDNLTLKVIGNAKWSYVKSLLSAIESEIFWENPFDEYKLTMTFANEYKNKWEIAQEKTFDRKRSIILFKN